MADDLLQAGAWKALQKQAGTLSSTRIGELLDQPGRFAAFSREQGNCLLDFSRNRLTTDTLKLLIDLASERQVPQRIQGLFAGEFVNATENRPALHTALRSGETEALLVNGRNIRGDIEAERERMLALAEAVRSGAFRGITGARIRHLVNIGIGGSDLGPVLAVQALHEFSSPTLEVHHVSTVDGTGLADVLDRISAGETLFIVCSKTFSTWETSLNAVAARTWLVTQLGAAAIARHFVGVSANPRAMDAFGIEEGLRFRVWEWVGGRYSLWSSVGLVLALAVGCDHFRAFLAGGRALDEHFRSAPLADNLPVLLALIAVWNQNFQGTTSQVVLPYDGRLRRLPAYLQQLEMESNGKGVTEDGQPVAWSTGTVIWGEPGSNAQHSFFQLLHQGTGNFAAEFVAPVEGSSPYADQHRVGLANLLAQAEALARGHSREAAEGELCAQGVPPLEAARLAAHRVQPGNHPSNILLLRRLDPHSLGFLVALYEHKVFVQACIWGINPFDQWGVERGKGLALYLHQELQREIPGADLPGIGGVMGRWDHKL